MQEVSIFPGGRYTEHILQGLDLIVARGKGLDLRSVSSCEIVTRTEYTILIEASARLMKVGATSPS